MYLINKYLIRKYKDSDLEAFTSLFMDEEVCKYMAGGAYDKKEDAEHLFHFLKRVSEQENATKKAYGIFLDEEYLGHFETELKKEEIEIVYVLHKAFWGKGIIKEVIEFFNENHSENLIARVMLNNTNSTKMLEKIGVASKKISKFDGKMVLKYTLTKK